MNPITDETLDLQVASFLRHHAEDLYGTPDARAMATRLAADVPLGARIALLFARPVARIALVGLLLAAALGVALVVGASRQGGIRNGLIVLEPYRAIDPMTGSISETAQCGGRCPRAMDAAWSSDGGQMVYVEDNRPFADRFDYVPGWSIWNYDVATDSLAKVTDCPPNGICGGLSYSPDGRSIAFLELDEYTSMATARRVVAIDLSTGARRQVELQGAPNARTAWLADGRVLTTVVPSRTTEPFDAEYRGLVLDPDAGTVADLDTPWPYYSAGVSADGSTIAFARYERHVRHEDTAGSMRPEDHMVEVWVADLAGTEPRRILHMPGHLSNSPVWSPDGQEIAIVIQLLDGSSNTLIIDVDTGASRELQSPVVVPPVVTAWLPAR